MTFVAAWVNLHHFNKPFVPKGVDLLNYPSTMLAITVVMAVMTAEWGVWAQHFVWDGLERTEVVDA